MVDALTLFDALAANYEISVKARFITSLSATFDAVIVVRDCSLISGADALCTISIPNEWAVNIPRIYCRETWIRRELDWHVYPAGNLCIDIQRRWETALGYARSFMTECEYAQYASRYFLNSAQWLMIRHRFGFENGLTSWPVNWPQWSHGLAGIAEYDTSLIKF
jgi:hypothetical protein